MQGVINMAKVQLVPEPCQSGQLICKSLTYDGILNSELAFMWHIPESEGYLLTWEQKFKYV